MALVEIFKIAPVCETSLSVRGMPPSTLAESQARGKELARLDQLNRQLAAQAEQERKDQARDAP